MQTLILKSTIPNFSDVYNFRILLGSTMVTPFPCKQKYFAMRPWIQVLPDPVGTVVITNCAFYEIEIAAIQH